MLFCFLSLYLKYTRCYSIFSRALLFVAVVLLHILITGFLNVRLLGNSMFFLQRALRVSTNRKSEYVDMLVSSGSEKCSF